jgi:hypothetical protein
MSKRREQQRVAQTRYGVSVSRSDKKILQDGDWQ